LTWQNLVKKAKKIKNLVEDTTQDIKNILFRLNLFKAEIVRMEESPLAETREIENIREESSNLLEEKTTKIETTEKESSQFLIQEPPPRSMTLEELQKELDDLEEEIDILSQKMEEFAKERGINLKIEEKRRDRRGRKRRIGMGGRGRISKRRIV